VIAEVVRAVGVRVIGNGDLASPGRALERVRETLGGVTALHELEAVAAGHMEMEQQRLSNS